MKASPVVICRLNAPINMPVTFLTFTSAKCTNAYMKGIARTITLAVYSALLIFKIERIDVVD